MDNSRLPTKALETMVTETRTRGKPKKRWKENIKQAIQKRGSRLIFANQRTVLRTASTQQLKTFINTASSSVLVAIVDRLILDHDGMVY